MYVRLAAIPPRSLDEAGRALFERVQRAACHVPALKTRPDFPIAVRARIDAPVYSDLLLHDMGAALADGVAKERPARATGAPRPSSVFVITRRLFARQSCECGRTSHFDARRCRFEAAESIRRYSSLNPEERAALLRSGMPFELPPT